MPSSLFVQRPSLRRLLLTGAAGSAMVAGSASAQSVSISTATTTPIATATASNGAPADISFTSTGSVIVTTGTAVTLNSNNSITNGGTITSQGTSDSTGLRIDAATNPTGNITNNGTINVTTSGTTVGTGNAGIRISGAGVFTGNIVAGNNSNISVTGNDATGILVGSAMTGNIGTRGIATTGTGGRGIAIGAALTGNIDARGAIVAAGAGSTGIQVGANVSGRITNGGGVTAGADQGFDAAGARVPAVAGVAAVHIGASVGGGFLNNRFFIDANGNEVPPPTGTQTATLVTGTLTAFGGAPALLVAPIGDNNVTMGLAGTGDEAFAIVNRGNVQSLGRNTGIATSAIRIGATGLAPGRVTLEGGLLNQTNGVVSAVTADAAAVAIEIGSGAVVPAIVNRGIIQASGAQTPAQGTTPAGSGGTATGILVQLGGNLSSITNSGTIEVAATGANGATAIRDAAGTITSITNSGSLLARAGAATAPARAIDLTGSTAEVSITSSGTITGNVVGGSGATSVALTGGVVNGNLVLGAGANSLALSGGARINGTISSGGLLALSVGAGTSLDLSGGTKPLLSSLTMTGNSILTIGAGTGVAGLSVSGAASFDADSRLRVAVTNVTASQNITLLTANGGITAAAPNALVDTASVPFLYTLGNVTVGANSISVALNRKSAADVGLPTGVANFFDQSLTALAGNTTLGPAIGNLGSQAALLGAYRQLLPGNYSLAPLRMAATMADAGFASINQRLTAIRVSGQANDLNQRGNLGLWVQQFGNFVRQREAGDFQGFDGSMLGIAVGVDKPLLGLDAVGLAFSFGWSDVDYGGLAGKPLLIDSQAVDFYAAKSWGGLFVALNAGAARQGYSSRRTLDIGGQTGTLAADWNGYSFSGNLQLGYTLTTGRLQITPSNTIGYLQLRQNGFTETGGGPLAITLDANSQRAATNTSKLAVEYGIPMGEGRLRFGASGAYVAQLTRSGLEYSGSFAGGGSPFLLTADGLRGSETQFGGYVSYTGPGWAAVLGYDRRQAGGYTGQALMATFRLVL